MMTPQQQVTAFLAHCTELRQGYFFAFNKQTSSLRHLISELERAAAAPLSPGLLQHQFAAKLAALNVSSPNDHQKYKPALASLFAVWGTAKDYVRVASEAQMIPFLQYWRTDGLLHDAYPGIEIRSKFPGYHQHVRVHLNALYATAAGTTILDALTVNRADLKRVTITDHVMNVSCGVNGITHGLNRVAFELRDPNTTRLGAQTLAALALAAPVPATRNRWLMDRINAMPLYSLNGIPPVVPANPGVTEEQVARWVEHNGDIWADHSNFAACNQIKNAIIVALYDHAASGTGAASTIEYSLGDLNPKNAERPPAIGLGHELVHAYYNLRGEQPGDEVGTFSTILFEYRCVGLGPWAGAPISENAIRAQWALAIPQFDVDDVRNRKVVPNRDYYSA